MSRTGDRDAKLIESRFQNIVWIKFYLRSHATFDNKISGLLYQKFKRFEIWKIWKFQMHFKNITNLFDKKFSLQKRKTWVKKCCKKEIIQFHQVFIELWSFSISAFLCDFYASKSFWQNRIYRKKFGSVHFSKFLCKCVINT